MVPFFQECGCHKLRVLKIYAKTFPESEEETVGGAEKEKSQDSETKNPNPACPSIGGPVVVPKVAVN